MLLRTSCALVSVPYLLGLFRCRTPRAIAAQSNSTPLFSFPVASSPSVRRLGHRWICTYSVTRCICRFRVRNSSCSSVFESGLRRAGSKKKFLGACPFDPSRRKIFDERASRRLRGEVRVLILIGLRFHGPSRRSARRSVRIARWLLTSATLCLLIYDIRLLPSAVSAGCATTVRRPFRPLSVSTRE